MSKKKLEAAKLALKKAKEALEKLKKTNKPKPKPRKKKARIELRGRRPKTNPGSSPPTRRIGQTGLDPKLKGKGKVKTEAVQQTIRDVRSPTRKRGVSDPARGLAFREMYRAGLKPVRTKEGKILTDERGRPIIKKPRKKKRGK
jgi:hypothetical protein